MTPCRLGLGNMRFSLPPNELWAQDGALGARGRGVCVCLSPTAARGRCGGSAGGQRGDGTLVSGQLPQNPACCCTGSSAWTVSSGVMAACEGCPSLAVPPCSSPATVGLVLHRLSQQELGTIHQLISSALFQWGWRPFPSRESQAPFNSGERLPGRRLTLCPDICPGLPQGYTTLSKQAKHHFSLSSPEPG